MKKTILIVESHNDVAFYNKLYSLAIKENEENDNLVDIVEFEDLHNFDYNGTIQRGYTQLLHYKIVHVKCPKKA